MCPLIKNMCHFCQYECVTEQSVSTERAYSQTKKITGPWRQHIAHDAMVECISYDLQELHKSYVMIEIMLSTCKNMYILDMSKNQHIFYAR